MCWIKAKDLFALGILVDDSLEYKQAKIVNRNVIATISHGEYKDVLMNKKSLSHSLNWIQSKDRRTYEINKISLPYFDEKMYIQNNGSDGFARGY